MRITKHQQVMREMMLEAKLAKYAIQPNSYLKDQYIKGNISFDQMMKSIRNIVKV